MIPKPIAVAIVCLVTMVWLAAFAAQFLVTGYVFDGYLHTVFLIIVGGALGLSRRGGDGGATPPNGGGTPPPPEPPPPTLPQGGAEASPPPDPAPPEPARAGGAHRAPFALKPRAAL